METQAEIRKQALTEYRRDEKDCGSPEVQIAMFTTRIRHLTEHLKKHKKDFTSRRGLMKMVGRRTRMLKYLSRVNAEQYHKVVDKLDLRK